MTQTAIEDQAAGLPLRRPAQPRHSRPRFVIPSPPPPSFPPPTSSFPRRRESMFSASAAAGQRRHLRTTGSSRTSTVPPVAPALSCSALALGVVNPHANVPSVRRHHHCPATTDGGGPPHSTPPQWPGRGCWVSARRNFRRNDARPAEGMRQGEMEAGGYPATSARHLSRTRDSRLRGNDEVGGGNDEAVSGNDEAGSGVSS